MEFLQSEELDPTMSVCHWDAGVVDKPETSDISHHNLQHNQCTYRGLEILKYGTNVNSKLIQKFKVYFGIQNYCQL